MMDESNIEKESREKEEAALRQRGWGVSSKRS